MPDAREAADSLPAKTSGGARSTPILRSAIQFLAPDMIATGVPATIIRAGSKQGITPPPGDTGYNVGKTALKTLTESLAHELVAKIGSRVTAYLLIPGFTDIGFTQARGLAEKPAGAWTAGQIADDIIVGIDAGEFYILRPDNEVDRETDMKRMRWSFGDILENRPALSRGYPDYAAAFKDWMASRN